MIIDYCNAIHVLPVRNNRVRTDEVTDTITTRPPAVTDVLGSGRNDGALRPARRVGFR